MNDASFFDRLQHNERPVVVDIWAPWCMPCRVIEPELARLSRDHQDQVDVWKVNADEQPDVVRALRVFGIPTLLVFRDGREILRRTGADPAGLVGLFEAARTGAVPVRRGPTPVDRLLRSLAGIALIVIGWQSGPALALLALGGALFFSAVYDRCPIWRMVTARLSAAFHRSSEPLAPPAVPQRKG